MYQRGNKPHNKGKMDPMSVCSMCTFFQQPRALIEFRMRKLGWTLEDALGTPKQPVGSKYVLKVRANLKVYFDAVREGKWPPSQQG